MKTVCLDFDGVIHRYSRGWSDGTIYDEPVPGVERAILSLQRAGYAVCVLSTRHPMDILIWWEEMLPNIPAGVVTDPNVKFWNDTTKVGLFERKPVASIYVDDRAFSFHPAVGWPEEFPWLLRALQVTK